MKIRHILLAALIAQAPFAVAQQYAITTDPTAQTDKIGTPAMIEQAKSEAEVRGIIEDLIQTATTYDIETLDRIYHDKLEVIMIDAADTLSHADKDAFKGLFQSKRDAGDPPMNTWAKYHDIRVDGKKAHVLLSRKNNLSGHDMALLLSIDLIREDDRWQVLREVIFLRPDA